MENVGPGNEKWEGVSNWRGGRAWVWNGIDELRSDVHGACEMIGKIAGIQGRGDRIRNEGREYGGRKYGPVNMLVKRVKGQGIYQVKKQEELWGRSTLINRNAVSEGRKEAVVDKNAIRGNV